MLLKPAGRDLMADPTQRILGRLKTKNARRPRPLATYADYLALRSKLSPERQKSLDVALYTGARRSELFRIEYGDIDFRNKRLHIRGTKTAGSDRTSRCCRPSKWSRWARPASAWCLAGR